MFPYPYISSCLHKKEKNTTGHYNQLPASWKNAIIAFNVGKSPKWNVNQSSLIGSRLWHAVVQLVRSLCWTVMAEGGSRARANPLSTHWEVSSCKFIRVVSVGASPRYQKAQPYSTVIVLATREAAKPKLVLYIMAIALASVASQYTDLIRLECRSHMLDIIPTYAYMAWKAVHNIQTYFSLSFSAHPLEKYGWPTTIFRGVEGPQSS